jgi:O-antigen ligase
MTTMDRRIMSVIYWFLAAICLTPLIFVESLQYPFVTTKTYFIQVLASIALPFYLYVVISNKNYRPNLRSPLTLSVLAFFFISLVSGFFGMNFTQSLFGAMNRAMGILIQFHLVLVYFYVLLVVQVDFVKAEKVRNAIMYVATACSLYGVWSALGLPLFMPDPFLPRISSTLGNPILLASYLIIPLAITLSKTLKALTTKSKVMFASCALLQLVAIYLSNTRAAFLALFSGAILFAVMHVLLNGRKTFRKYRWITLGLATLVLIVAAVVLVTKLRLGDSGSQARLYHWKIAISGFKDHPVLGVGPENYYLVSDKHATAEVYKYDAQWFDKPHNNVLEIIATTGVLGLLSYLSILGMFGRQLYLAFRDGKISPVEFSLLMSGLLAFVIQGLFSFDTQASLLVFYLLLGLVSSYREVEIVSKKNDNVNDTAARFGFGLAAVLVIYLIYITTYLPAKANYYSLKGVSYASSDSSLAKEFLDKAASIDTVNLQASDTSRYYQYLSGQMQQKKSDVKIAEASLVKAVELMEGLTSKVGNNPRYWYNLASMYYDQAALAVNIKKDDKPYLEKAESALGKALNLTSSGPEFLLLSARIKLVRQDLAATNAELNKFYQLIGDTNNPWFGIAGNREDLLATLDLLINYYTAKKDYPMLIKLYNLRIDADHFDIQSRAKLAAAYLAVGDKDNAWAAAAKIIEVNPEAKPEVEKFLKMLEEKYY